MIKKNRAKNSFSNRNKRIDADKKLLTKHSTECSGFFEMMTIAALINSTAEKKLTNKIIVYQRQDLNLQSSGHEPNMLTNALLWQIRLKLFLYDSQTIQYLKESLVLYT